MTEKKGKTYPNTPTSALIVELKNGTVILSEISSMITKTKHSATQGTQLTCKAPQSHGHGHN
jgi:hypothetical protein